MINAYQHAGIGVHDAGASLEFYRNLLGFRIKANDGTAYREEQVATIGALVELRIIMASNPMGGGVIELCEHTSTKPLEPEQPVRWGDLGFFELGIKARDLSSLYLNLKNRGVDFLTPVRAMELSGGEMLRHAYLRDPDGLLIQLVETEPAGNGAGKGNGNGKGKGKGKGNPRAGGVHHVGLGVRDMESMRRFYGEVFGYTEVEHEFKGYLPELDEVTGGEEMEVVMLKRPDPPPGEYRGSLPGLDAGRLKLVRTTRYQGVPIYRDRRWGDIGMMEMAFDVDDIAGTVNSAIAGGASICLAPMRVDMGTGSAGSVAYVTDPEGNYLELVETEKVFWMKPALLNKVLTPLLKLLS